MGCGTLIGVPYGPARDVGSFAIEAANDAQLQSILFGQEMHEASFSVLYSGLSQLLSVTYVPDKERPISSQSLTAFIRLIQANPTSAAFSFLTMYSIRHRTLTDHPGSFDHLFSGLFDFGKLFHGIGKLTITSLSPLHLIKIHRRPIPIEPPHSNKIPHPFHLEPTARRVG